MKNFKQILSLIAEAKFEPGGKDLGVLFGPNGPFSPYKGIKEPSAQEKFTKGDLDYRLMPVKNPNSDRTPKSEPVSQSKIKYFDKYGRLINPWDNRKFGKQRWKNK